MARLFDAAALAGRRTKVKAPPKKKKPVPASATGVKLPEGVDVFPRPRRSRLGARVAQFRKRRRARRKKRLGKIAGGGPLISGS